VLTIVSVDGKIVKKINYYQISKM